LDTILKLHKRAAHMGMENAEAIAAVDGIDMIAYGHSDLSARPGVHLQLEHPTFRATVRQIAEACGAHGKLARGSAETEAPIAEYWRLGCKALNLPSTDVSTYLDGLKARASRAHARLKSIGCRCPETWAGQDRVPMRSPVLPPL
jgi:2-keto-3-deoxy-L-rhamnonate aldolase RhmA